MIDVGGPVHVLEWTGVEGPTFVCVHGLGGSHTNWLSLAPLLATRGRVLVIDLIGFGRTPLGERTASVQSNVKLVEAFLEVEVAGPAILLGNSMGGYISMSVASASPELVSGLVLVDPAIARTGGQAVDRTVAALFATYMIPKVGERFVEARVRKLGPERVMRDTLALCCVDPSRVPQSVIDAQLALAHERFESMPWATTAFLQAARSLLGQLARRARFDAMVREISAPALLVMGTHDRLVPIAAARRLASLRPDWDFVEFGHLGHVPQMEDAPAVFAAIETWLDGPAARALGSVRAAEETR